MSIHATQPPAGLSDPFAAQVAYPAGLNLRAAPSIKASILRKLPKGDAVTVFLSPRTVADGHTWVWLTDALGNAGYGAIAVNGLLGFNPPVPAVDVTPEPIDTPVVALGVPYVTQASSTANHYRNDCGCSCALMLLRFAYARAGLLDPTLLTVDDLAAKTTLPLRDNGLTSEQLVTLLRGYGAPSQKVILLTANMVRAMLKAGTPVICLLNYGEFKPNSSFKGGHFAVAVGYGAKGVYFHDPYEGGANFYITNTALDKALANMLAFASTSNQGVILTSEA